MRGNLAPPSELLLREIEQDMRPVTPASLPSRLALRLAPLVLLFAMAAPALIGLRPDTPALGPILAWGASAAELSLAVLLVWVAARESTPDRRLPVRLVWLASVASAALFVVFALWTFAAAPALTVPRRMNVFAGFACGIGTTLAGALLVAAFGLLFRRALVVRPAFSGALFGAGAGFAVNAGWRLACPLSTPWHALAAHGAGIAAASLIGALLAAAISRTRNSRLPQRFV